MQKGVRATLIHPTTKKSKDATLLLLASHKRRPLTLTYMYVYVIMHVCQHGLLWHTWKGKGLREHECARSIKFYSETNILKMGQNKVNKSLLSFSMSVGFEKP